MLELILCIIQLQSEPICDRIAKANPSHTTEERQEMIEEIAEVLQVKNY